MNPHRTRRRPTRPLSPAGGPAAVDPLEPRRLMSANTAGIPDPTFDGGHVVDVLDSIPSVNDFYRVDATAVAPDGKIVLAGLESLGGGATGVAVVRLNPDGTFDSSFGVTSSDPLIDPSVTAVVVAPDGSVDVAENDYGYDFGDSDPTYQTYASVIQFSAAGVPAAILPIGDGSYENHVAALSLQPDGTVFAVGYQADELADGNDGPRSFAMARFDARTLAPSPLKFNDYRGKGSVLMAAAPGPNGTVVVAGESTSGAYVARLKADGSVDTAFKLSVPSSSPLHAATGVNGVAVGPDGKVGVLHYALVSGSYVDTVTRLTTSGQVDTSFDKTGSLKLTGSLFRIAAQPDGKVVLAGTAMSDGVERFAAVRLTAGGALDGTFGLSATGTERTGAAEDSVLTGLAVDGDGRLVLVGNASSQENDPIVTRLLPGEFAFHGTPTALSATGTTTVQAEDFDDGGEGVAYHDTDAYNHSADESATYFSAYRPGSGVDVERNADAGGGGQGVAYAFAGEYLKYTVTVATAGTYAVAARVADQFGGGKYHLSVDGGSAGPTQTTPNTGSFLAHQTASAGTVTLSAGTHVIRVSFDRADTQGTFVGNFDRFTFTAPKPAAARLTGKTIGTAGSYQNKGNVAAKATDGSLSTYFDAATASGAYVGYDLGSAKKVTQIKFAPRSGYASRMVGGVFQASNSSTFATGVVTVYTVGTAPASGSLTTVSPTTTTAYRYWRYVGPANSYCDVAEFELFG